MSDRPTITTLPAGGRYDVATLNTNFTAVRNQFDELMGRNGTGGSNNSASGNIDMNGNNLLNVGDVLNTAGAGFVSSVDYAEEWANKAEDSLVSVAAGGDGVDDYSSKHFSIKATAQVTLAAAQVTLATAQVALAAGHVTTAAGEASATAPKYTFSTTTSMADPGAGILRYNHGTVASVTAIAIDDTTADTGNPDVEAWLKTFDDSTSTIKGWIRLVEPGTPANYAIFNVTAVADNSGWVQLTVAHVDSNGTFSDADSIRLFFSRTGDLGATGATGSGEGLELAFESTTTDTDQGVGKVWYNNGTVSSASIFYIDDVDANSASINSFVDSWDDSGSTIKGRLTVKKQTAPENFHMFDVNGSVTSASTYSKIPVAYVTSVGTISDADAVFVSFSRTGDKGTTGDTGGVGPVGIGLALALGG